MTNIKKGSVVRLWHPSRGNDYVVVGKNPTNKELLLVKLNCLNDDGTIHKATKRVHKRLGYSSITGSNIVKEVTSVIGQKNINKYDFSRIFNSGDVQLHANQKFICSRVPTRTVSFSFK